MLPPRVTARCEITRNRFFSVASEELELFDGQPYTYHQIESHYDAVVVVPVLADGRLVCERIYRHPYGRTFLEFPAGGIEPGEDPLVAGARELEEETGYRASTLEPLVSFEVMPGLLRMRIHIVLASGLVDTGTQALEAMELLEVVPLTPEQAWAEARGAAASSFLTMGLLALERRLP